MKTWYIYHSIDSNLNLSIHADSFVFLNISYTGFYQLMRLAHQCLDSAALSSHNHAGAVLNFRCGSGRHVALTTRLVPILAKETDTSVFGASDCFLSES